MSPEDVRERRRIHQIFSRSSNEDTSSCVIEYNRIQTTTLFNLFLKSIIYKFERFLYVHSTTLFCFHLGNDYVAHSYTMWSIAVSHLPPCQILDTRSMACLQRLSIPRYPRTV